MEVEIEKVYAIIIAYNANKDKLSKLVDNIKQQKVTSIIVANDSMQYGRINAEVISNQHNLGIAEAQNIGIKWAIKHGAEFIALFDQDSEIPALFFEKMMFVYARSLQNGKNTGIIVPRIYDVNMKSYIESRIYFKIKKKIRVEMPNENAKKILNDRCYRIVAKPIASGAFIPTDVFKKVGFMDSNLFIDLVDTDFDFRVLESGFQIIQANSVELLHRIGKRKQVNLLGFKIWPTNHSAERRFTIARNTIWMWKKHHKNISGLSKETMRTLISTFVYIQLEDRSFSKNISFFKGIYEGAIKDGKS